MGVEVGHCGVVTLESVSHRLEFVVLAGLILLGLEARNAFIASANIERELFALNLNLSRFLLEGFQTGSAFRQLQFEMLSLQRKIFYLVLDLPDLLLSILKDE